MAASTTGDKPCRAAYKARKSTLFK